MRNRTASKIKLVLIRHGMTASNELHRYVGSRTDEPLSEKGRIRLMEGQETLKKRLAGQSPEFLLVSPMRRCLETAKLLFPDREQLVVKQWKEMDFGTFEGKSYEQLKDEPAYQSWIDGGGKAPFPEGESREEFARRVREGWQYALKQVMFHMEQQESALQQENELQQENAEQQENRQPPLVCAVVHGGTIMELCSLLEGGDYFDYQVSNGCGYSGILLLDQEVRLAGEMTRLC